MGRGSWNAGWDIEGFKLDYLLFHNNVFRTVNVKHSNIALAMALSALIVTFYAVQHSSH